MTSTTPTMSAEWMSAEKVKEMMQSTDISYLQGVAIDVAEYQRSSIDSDAERQQDQLMKLRMILWNRVLQLQRSNESPSEEMAQTLRSMGNLWIEVGEVNKALGQLNKAAELDPDDASTQLLISRAYFNAAEYDSSVIHQEKGIDILEKSDEIQDVKAGTETIFAYATLAKIYEAKGEFGQSVSILQKMEKKIDELDLDSNSEEADVATLVFSRLGTLQEKIGEYKAAVGALQKARDLLLKNKGESDPATQEISYLLEMASNMADE